MSSRAQRAIARLDAALARDGEDIRLQRRGLGPNGTKPLVAEATCRAKLTNYAAADIVPGSGIAQQDVHIVISATGITRAGWPGGTPVKKGAPDPRIPSNKTDSILAARGTMAVQDAKPVYIDGELVRLDIQARGN